MTKTAAVFCVRIGALGRQYGLSNHVGMGHIHFKTNRWLRVARVSGGVSVPRAKPPGQKESQRVGIRDLLLVGGAFGGIVLLILVLRVARRVVVDAVAQAEAGQIARPHISSQITPRSGVSFAVLHSAEIVVAMISPFDCCWPLPWAF